MTQETTMALDSDLFIPELGPAAGNAKGVAQTFYVNLDSRNPGGGTWFDREHFEKAHDLLVEIVLQTNTGVALKNFATHYGVDSGDLNLIRGALQKHTRMQAISNALRDQAVFCGGNHYGFGGFGGEAVRLRDGQVYIAESEHRVQRFLDVMRSLNLQQRYTPETMLGVWEEFTRHNTDLFATDNSSDAGEGFYLRMSATANRANGAGVSGESLVGTVMGEAWVWPDPLSLMQAPARFAKVSYNKIGVHDSRGSRHKYTSAYQDRVAVRTAHKERYRDPDTEQFTVTDVFHHMPDGMPGDFTAQNAFLLYSKGGGKVAVFPKGPFFLGATRKSLMAVFAHTGYKVHEPQTIDEFAEAAGISIGDEAHPYVKLLQEADFVGGCGTTYAILGVGEVRFPAGGHIVLDTTNFPQEQVDCYFKAVVGLDTVPGVQVHSFPLER